MCLHHKVSGSLKFMIERREHEESQILILLKDVDSLLIVCCVISHLQGRCQCAAVRWSAEDRRWEVGHDLRERTTYPETVKPKQRSNSNNTLPCHHTWHKLTDLTRDRQMCTDVSKVCVPASYSLLPSYPTMRALPGPAFQIYTIFQLNTTAVIPRSIVATDL